MNRIERLNKLSLEFNGGPGSGNFNPGQGRGVGKPANGSNKSSTTFSVDDYSKERLNEVLEKYGVETDTNIGIAISNAAWRNGNKEDYKKVEKILEERYGEDWYDNDEAEKDADYLEYLERKAKRIEELQKKIYSELGIEFDPNSFWISKETYDGIQKAIKEGKLKEFINGDTPLAEEDPNFVRDPETAIGFYRQKSFNFDNGNFNVEMMTSSSESGYSDISEDNFINKSDYDNFMKRKMVKVNNDEVHSWYTILDKAGTYPPISRAEERSLQEYNLASAVNQQLREGKTSKTAENIASAINKKYSHSDEVYRGIRGDFAKKISSLKKGDTVTDKGFMSTSSIIGGDDSGAAKFGKTIMKIKTKSGFGQSIDMSPYVKDMRYLDEGEILLQKDTTVKYTGNSSKTIDKDGNDIMIYEFEVE